MLSSFDKQSLISQQEQHDNIPQVAILASHVLQLRFIMFMQPTPFPGIEKPAPP